MKTTRSRAGPVFQRALRIERSRKSADPAANPQAEQPPGPSPNAPRPDQHLRPVAVARMPPTESNSMAMTRPTQPRVLQGYFRAERFRGSIHQAAAIQLMRPNDWAAKAPRPDLMPARTRGGAAQARPGASWPGAPRPDLLPGMGTPRGVAQPRASQAVSTMPIPAGQLRVIGEGRSLEPELRQTMETFFQADFSRVRVYEGPAAPAMGALAFTLGEQIHFAPGLYDPESREGVALLGHELTHVVQQRDGRVANPYGHGVAIVQDPALEAEADRMGQQIAAEMWSGSRTARLVPSAQTSQARSSRPGTLLQHPADPARFAQRHPAVAQPMEMSLSTMVGDLLGTKVPEGVEHLRDLKGGFGVGYHAGQQRILLYNRSGVLAHIDIQTHQAYRGPSSISLHTRTDKGEEGGQGYMAAMFGDALVVVAAEFSQFTLIEMAPAMGAATKGLVSQLSRLRMSVRMDELTRFASAHIFMAKKFLTQADQLRKARREKSKSSKSSHSDPQAWDSTLMKETTLELNALAEMEMACSTGLVIVGITGGFAKQLVGVGSPALFGGAWEWYRSADEHTKQGMLQVTMPMSSIDLYIEAAGEEYVTALTRRRKRRRDRIRLRRMQQDLENERALGEARRILDRLPTPPPMPQIETLEDWIKK